MIHECQLDEHGRCQSCTKRFEDIMRDIHTHECHRSDTGVVHTPIGFRLIRFLRNTWRKTMQIARSLISRPEALATAIPDYRTPEQLDRKALFMSGRDFNLTGGWKQSAIKANRRYLQAENDLVLLKETLKAQAAALEAKDELIKHRFTHDSTYRPGDPRRDLRMRLDPDACRHTLAYLCGTARQCGLCFQINPRAASDQALRRIVDPGRIVD